MTGSRRIWKELLNEHRLNCGSSSRLKSEFETEINMGSGEKAKLLGVPVGVGNKRNSRERRRDSN